MAMQRLIGKQLVLSELSYLPRLLTDWIGFSYAYINFDTYDDFDNNELASLFVCL